ncbi:hypothetical protein PIB30_049132 [Stylosanthes scabra]|nr:hypothetical protein [Stylosanthes scabra]
MTMDEYRSAIEESGESIRWKTEFAGSTMKIGDDDGKALRRSCSGHSRSLLSLCSLSLLSAISPLGAEHLRVAFRRPPEQHRGTAPAQLREGAVLSVVSLC